MVLINWERSRQGGLCSSNQNWGDQIKLNKKKAKQTNKQAIEKRKTGSCWSSGPGETAVNLQRPRGGLPTTATVLIDYFLNHHSSSSVTWLLSYLTTTVIWQAAKPHGLLLLLSWLTTSWILLLLGCILEQSVAVLWLIVPGTFLLSPNSVCTDFCYWSIFESGNIWWYAIPGMGIMEIYLVARKLCYFCAVMWRLSKQTHNVFFHSLAVTWLKAGLD